MTDRGCSVDGCPRPHSARGLCHAHWQRAKARGELDRHQLSHPPKVLEQVAADHACTVPDLLGRNRAFVAARDDAAARLIDAGLSRTRAAFLLGARHRNTIDHALTKPRQTVPTRPVPDWPACTVPGCDRDTKTAGMCTGHYARWKRHGDISADVPLRAIREDDTVLDLEVHNRTGYRNGCRCDTCRADAVRHVKRNRHRPKRVPVADGLAALERATATGLSIPQVARAVGVGNAGLYHWRSGRGETCLRETVEAIEKLADERSAPRCEDCGRPSLADGRWCLRCFQGHADQRSAPSWDPACGTDRGYQRHWRIREKPCDPCKDAHSVRGRARAS